MALIVEGKRILARRDVASIDAAQSVRFQMAHQRAITTARFGERAHPTEKRNQRWYGRERRPVEIRGIRSKPDERLPMSG